MKMQGIYSNCENDDGILDPVPPCFLSHLKCVKVCNYIGSGKQPSAMKILLKNAVVLDKMVLSYSNRFAQDFLKRRKATEQLLEFPRGSKNCEFVFEWAFHEFWLSDKPLISPQFQLFVISTSMTCYFIVLWTWETYFASNLDLLGFYLPWCL